jgi:hypothetical protein
MVATFADLSLKRRAVAALNVIDANPGLSIAERSELVCVAIWPTDLELPGPVRRDELLFGTGLVEDAEKGREAALARVRVRANAAPCAAAVYVDNVLARAVTFARKWARLLPKVR